MKPILRDYQKQALDFCMKRLYLDDEKGAGLFLDPGLGKTLITLKLIQYLHGLGDAKNILVVAPLRVCQLVWGQEIDKWEFDFSVNLMCKRVKKGLKTQATIDLINPESLHLMVDHAHHYDMIVVDESPKFKTWTCKRMKAMRKMIGEFKKRLILTGTPASNSLADLHGQIFILDDGVALGRNVTVFRSMYMYQGGWQGREWKLRNDVKDSIHEAVAPLCLRLDAESCLDMPELVTRNIMVDMPASCKAGYRTLKRELLIQLEQQTVLAQNAASAYMKCKQYANGQIYDEERDVHKIHTAKVEAVVDLVDELSGKNLLLFYQFAHDAEALKKRFPKAPVLCGATKEKAAIKMLDDWNKGKTHVFLVQNQAASHGLNMQEGGSDVGYFGLNDSLEIYEQSFRRIYRSGVKSRQVRIHRFLTMGTVDEIIRDRLEGKDQTQKAFLKRLKDHACAGTTWISEGMDEEFTGQSSDRVVELNSGNCNKGGEHEDRPAMQPKQHRLSAEQAIP